MNKVDLPKEQSNPRNKLYQLLIASSLITPACTLEDPYVQVDPEYIEFGDENSDATQEQEAPESDAKTQCESWVKEYEYDPYIKVEVDADGACSVENAELVDGKWVPSCDRLSEGKLVELHSIFIHPDQEPFLQDIRRLCASALERTKESSTLVYDVATIGGDLGGGYGGEAQSCGIYDISEYKKQCPDEFKAYLEATASPSQ